MSTITVYRVPPQQEFKAARELRQAGFRAYLPVETVKRRRQPVARGYIAADGKPNEAKHVRKRVGEVERVELIKLYQRRDRGHEKPQVAFEAGNTVKLSQRYTVDKGKTVDVVGILVKKRGRRQWLVDIGGKQVCAQTTSLIRIDPG